MKLRWMVVIQFHIPTINFQGANAAVAEQMAKDVEIDESDPAIQSLRKALEEVEIVGRRSRHRIQ